MDWGCSQTAEGRLWIYSKQLKKTILITYLLNKYDSVRSSNILRHLRKKPRNCLLRYETKKSRFPGGTHSQSPLFLRNTFQVTKCLLVTLNVFLLRRDFKQWLWFYSWLELTIGGSRCPFFYQVICNFKQKRYKFNPLTWSQPQWYIYI